MHSLDSNTLFMRGLILSLSLGAFLGAFGGVILAFWKQMSDSPPSWLRTYKLRPWRPKISTWAFIGAFCVSVFSTMGFLLGHSIGTIFGILMGTFVFVGIFVQAESHYHSR
jgi:hypothetical protein